MRVYSLPSTPPPNLVWAPAPPTNVVAYSPGPSQINVSWQAPASTFGATVSGYTIQRATDSAFTQNVARWNTGAATSFADNKVPPGGSYYYRVAATSANGTSDPSAAALAAALSAASNSKLLYVCARGFVGTGARALLGGFVVGGSSPKTSSHQGFGGPRSPPALLTWPERFPIPSWCSTAEATSSRAMRVGAAMPSIASAAAEVSAFAWSDASSNDAALLMTLVPGAYTAIVSGAHGDTGVSLLEVYDVQ